jgi:hypothetical protein
MSYSFRGIFTNLQSLELVAAAKAQWPFCRVRKIDAPFEGIGIAGNETDDWAEFERLHFENKQLESGLLSFSTIFPDGVFVYTWVDCDGGQCIYEGFACINGALLVDNRGEDSRKFSQNFEREKLRRLMRHLGVELGGLALFEPFERGYFETETL